MKHLLRKYTKPFVRCKFHRANLRARDSADHIYSARFRHDQRTWKQRLTDFHRNWKPLIDSMVDAYLQWKYIDTPRADSDKVPKPTQPPSGLSSNPVADPPSTSRDTPSPQPDTNHNGGGINQPGTSTRLEVEVSVIDIYTLSTSVKLSCEEDQTTASTLVSLGFIGNAPFKPSIAVSLKTLELYRILRRRKPSLSIEAFTKVICDLYMVRSLFLRPLPLYIHIESRFHTVPGIVGCFQTLLMCIWRSSGLLINVSRQHLATMVRIGVY